MELQPKNITYGRITSTAFPLLLTSCLGNCLNPLQLISGRNKDNLHHKMSQRNILVMENCADLSLYIHCISYLYPAL